MTAALQTDRLRASAAHAVSVLKLLGNEDRLLLLCELSTGEKTVAALESSLGIHQPTLSQQLGVLRQENVVQTRREGKHIVYSLTDSDLKTLLNVLYELYCKKGDAL